MHPEILPLLHPPPSAYEGPRVLVLAGGPHAPELVVRACRYFEPHARVRACAHLADAFRNIVSDAPDLLLLEPALCADQLSPLIQHARRFAPRLTIALIGAEPETFVASLPGPRPRADASLSWSELPLWLAQALPRLRCRAQLDALQPGAFGETTQPSSLIPAA